MDMLNEAEKASNLKSRADGWANALTGLGMLEHDKRLGSEYKLCLLNRMQLEVLWRGSDLAGKIIEKPVDQALRKGFEIKIKIKASDATKPKKAFGDDKTSDEKGRKDALPLPLPEAPTPPPGVVEPQEEDTAEQQQAIKARLEELDTVENFREALHYARVFGGGALLLGVKDGKGIDQPLDPDAIKTLEYLTPIPAYELQPVSYYADLHSPKYGKPEIYRLQPSVTVTGSQQRRPTKRQKEVWPLIHESRLLLFHGIPLTRQARLSNPVAPGWDDSILQRVHQVLSDFDLTWHGVAILLHDFSQAVIKIEDLAHLITADRADVVVTRAKLIDLTRSVARAVLLDKEEDYERKATPVNGLAELLQEFCIRLAAAVDMPVTVLFGRAPAGMNATGESDIDGWHETIAAFQTCKIKPQLDRLVKLVCRSKDGPTGGKEPESICVEFNPLRQQTEAEKIATRKVQADIDAMYIDKGVLTPEECTTSRFGGSSYSYETSIDFEGRKTLAAEYEQELKDHESKQAEVAKQAQKEKDAKSLSL